MKLQRLCAFWKYAFSFLGGGLFVHPFLPSPLHTVSLSPLFYQLRCNLSPPVPSPRGECVIYHLEEVVERSAAADSYKEVCWDLLHTHTHTQGWTHTNAHTHTHTDTHFENYLAQTDFLRDSGADISVGKILSRNPENGKCICDSARVYQFRTIRFTVSQFICFIFSIVF